jgi:hypothetical protein
MPTGAKPTENTADDGAGPLFGLDRPRSPEFRRLEQLLTQVADLLPTLPDAEFGALCRQEMFELRTSFQYLEFADWPDSMPPALLLGNMIIERAAQRHPLWATDDDDMAGGA